MKKETVDKYQNAAIAFTVGLVVPIAIGFGGGFWVTKDMADRMANSATLTARAEVCVGQFTNAPDHKEKLKQYEALDYSGRSAFIEKAGWARMPGEDKASDAVKEACGRRLEALQER